MIKPTGTRAAASGLALALVLSLGACSASPEVKVLCQEYVAKQARSGSTVSPDKALERCLRLSAKQVRCLMTASGRNAKIACTQ